ncbi:DUF2691 family protein [Solibaculum intestinale]|uniref:DUF2691 family protein n=1 Tax=Solibaculum intestinale TaxID=3133165 RepID=A0ABV1E3D1_9FIRM
MRGMSFLVPNQYDSVLAKILEGILLEDYIWKIDEDEILLSRNGDFKDLFETHILKGQEFRKTVDTNSYLVIFANIQGYFSLENHKDLETYQDFLNSTCQIVILICDTIYVEIYAKDRKIIEKIKFNAEYYGFEEVEYITDENDGRTSLHF